MVEAVEILETVQEDLRNKGGYSQKLEVSHVKTVRGSMVEGFMFSVWSRTQTAEMTAMQIVEPWGLNQNGSIESTRNAALEKGRAAFERFWSENDARYEHLRSLYGPGSLPGDAS